MVMVAIAHDAHQHFLSTTEQQFYVFLNHTSHTSLSCHSVQEFDPFFLDRTMDVILTIFFAFPSMKIKDP